MIRRAVPIAATLVALLTPASSAEAWCQLTTLAPEEGSDPLACAEEGLPLSWFRGNISYSFEIENPDTILRLEAAEAFDEAFDSWLGLTCDGAGHGLSVRQGDQVLCDVPFHDTGGPNSNAIIFARDWNARGYPDAALANTTIWFRPSSGEILDADMELNEGNRDLEICPEDGCSGAGLVDLPSVATHEIGHFFGLGHSEVPEATMFPTAAATGTSLRTLDEDDVEGFCTIYGGVGLQVSSFDPRGGFTAECAPEGGGGCQTGGGTAGALSGLALAAALGRWRRRRPRKR